MTMYLKELTKKLIVKCKEGYFEYVKGIAWHISAQKIDISELPIYYSFGFANDITTSELLPPLTCPHCGRETFKPYYYLCSHGSGWHRFDGICTKCLHTENNMKNDEYHKKFIQWLFHEDEDED